MASICFYREKRPLTQVKIFSLFPLMEEMALNALEREKGRFYLFSFFSTPEGDPNLGCDPTSEFDCAGDGTLCVGLDRVCDRKNDCGNWQDEPPDLCGVDECRRRNGGCEHKCVDMKLGFRCECKQGYELKANGSCVGKKRFFAFLFPSCFCAHAKVNWITY